MPRVCLFVAALLVAAAPVLASSASIPSSVAAQNRAGLESGTVSGRVIDQTGLPVPGATIAAGRGDGALRAVVGATGPDGQFEVVLPPGPNVIVIVASGFEPVRREVTIGEPGIEVVLVPARRIEHVTVVSASRQVELRDTLATRVDVVGRQRLDVPRTATGDLLRELPGVLSRRGSEGTSPAGTQVQGLESRQVAVLVDGQPVPGARGIKSGVVNLDRQPIDALDRVEVVKGAASALFGSDAIGGVVNLISRTPERPLEASVSAAAGSFGLSEVTASLGASRGRAALFATAGRRDRDSVDLTPSTVDVTSPDLARRHGFVKSIVRPSSAIQFTGTGAGDWTTQAGVVTGESGPLDNRIRERGGSAHGTLDWSIGWRTQMQARAYVADYLERSTGQPLDGGAEEIGRLHQRFTKLDATAGVVLGRRQHLQAGVEWWRDRYDGINRLRDDAGHEATTGVAWVQDRISIADRITITAGGRFDHHSVFGNALTPRAAVHVRATDALRLRASWGEGFRAPDLGQLYYRYLPSINVYQVIGNPELEPEESRSWQAGGDFAPSHGRLRVGINAFHNEVDDLIEAVSLGFLASPGQLQGLVAAGEVDPSFEPALFRLLFAYRNLSKVRTRGVELDGEVIVGHGVTVAGAYTFLDADDRESGTPLAGRHRHQGFARATWSGRRTLAEVRASLYGAWLVASRGAGGSAPAEAKAFALWDVIVRRQLAGGAALYAAVDNVYDSQDPNTGRLDADGTPAAIYRPEAGRTLRVGLTWTWEAR